MNSTDLLNDKLESPVQLNYADTCWILVIVLIQLQLNFQPIFINIIFQIDFYLSGVYYGKIRFINMISSLSMQ